MLEALMSADPNTSPSSNSRSIASDNNNSYFRVHRLNLQKLTSYAPITTKDEVSCREESHPALSDEKVAAVPPDADQSDTTMSVHNFDKASETTNFSCAEPTSTSQKADEELPQPRPRLPSGSSLKSSRSKTPPLRKSVRFADALGLDLETIRILTSDIPAPDVKRPETNLPTTQSNRYLSLHFAQPSSLPNFLRLVHHQKVVLENILVTDLSILGTVKVSNVAYDKSVRVRFTADCWRSFSDIPANYVQGSCDGPSDRFSFGISVPRDSDLCEFAIRYEAGGMTFWDNNDGRNYTLECLSKKETHSDS